MSREKFPKYPRKIRGYDIGVSRWEVGVKDIEGKDFCDTGSIIYVAGEFANTGLSFDFSVNGEETHGHEFGEVIKCLLAFPETFSIKGFEDEYSQQEIEMLKAVQKRALEVKKEEKCIR